MINISGIATESYHCCGHETDQNMSLYNHLDDDAEMLPISNTHNQQKRTTISKSKYNQTYSVTNSTWRQAKEDYVEEEICLLRL